MLLKHDYIGMDDYNLVRDWIRRIMKPSKHLNFINLTIYALNIANWLRKDELILYQKTMNNDKKNLERNNGWRNKITSKEQHFITCK